MDIVSKLQQQPEHIRKIILWTVVIILGVVLLGWWLRNSYNALEKLQSENVVEQFELPAFQDALPDFEIPILDMDAIQNVTPGEPQ